MSSRTWRRRKRPFWARDDYDRAEGRERTREPSWAPACIVFFRVARCRYTFGARSFIGPTASVSWSSNV